MDVGEPPSPALRLRGFVPVELVRRDTAVAPRRRPVAAGEPGEPVVQALPAAPEPRPDPGHGWADPFTLFVDADL